jgi:hypothetical protein
VKASTSKARTSGKSPTPLLVVPSTTGQEVLKQIHQAGYLPLPCDHPDAIRLLSSHSPISGDDLLMSAMHGVVSCGQFDNHMEVFAKELYRRMRENEKTNIAKEEASDDPGSK